MKAMSALTGLLYAALIAYLGGWYTGYWNGNFSLLLLILTTVTLAYWLAERFHFDRTPEELDEIRKLLSKPRGGPR